MSLPSEPPPADLPPTGTPRLGVLLWGLAVLAGFGFASMGLGLLQYPQGGWYLRPLLACGLALLITVGGWQLKSRRPDAPAAVRAVLRWLLYLCAGFVLLPLAIIAGGSLLFFLWTAQMVWDPGYRPYGPPMTAPVGELLLAVAALAGLVGLLAYVIWVIHRDY